MQERVDNRKTPQNTVKLLTSTIKSGADEEGLRYCFRVVSPEKIYLLQVRFNNIQECLCMHDAKHSKLMMCTIEDVADEESLQYCFTVVSSESILLLQVRGYRL